MHENLMHTVIKRFTKKYKSINTFRHLLPTVVNTFSGFISNNIDTTHFQTKWYYTLFQSSYNKKLTLSESYYQRRVNAFSEFISDAANTFRELLPNNATHFFRDIKQYWQFQRVTGLANNTIHFYKASIKQYWHFQRVPSKLNYNKNFFQSSCYTILTLSLSYYQTILTYWELIPNIIHTFTESLPNNCKLTWEFEWTLQQTENYQTRISQAKVRKVSIHTLNRILLSTILEFTW